MAFPRPENAYLSSIGDMMAALLFLFVIALMVFAIDIHLGQDEARRLAGAKARLQERTQELTRARDRLRAEADDLAAAKAELEAETRRLAGAMDELSDAKASRDRLLADLEAALATDGVAAEADPARGILRLPQDVLFPFGSDELQPAGGRALAGLARALARLLPCHAGNRGDPRPAACPPGRFLPGRLEAVVIEGHTDNVPVGRDSPFADNWDLSAARAIKVYERLLADAPALGRLTNPDGLPLFGVSGYGDSRPKAPHAEPTRDARNRRIALRFILAAPRMDAPGARP